MSNVSPLRPLAPNEVPHAVITPAGRTVTWFGTDTQGRHAATPHPTLGPDGVSYTFNSLGYRGAEPPRSKQAGTLTMLSVGASEVFGLGVPAPTAFPAVLADLLAQRVGMPVVDVNLGFCGAAADYVARTLASAIGAVQPDIVVFVLPAPVRREHINDLGRIFLYPNAYSPTWRIALKNRLKYLLFDPENSMQNTARERLSSDANDALNYFRNYAASELLCRRHGAMWAFGVFQESFLAGVRDHIDLGHYVGPGIADMRDQLLAEGVPPAQCWARDMGHPGVAAHRRMAERFAERLYALYGPTLGQRPRPFDDARGATP